MARHRFLGAALVAALSFSSQASLAAQSVPDLYDETVLRTIELNFRQTGWWQQLLDNKEAKVYIPADLTVDGVVYPNVGVRFKGDSSYTGVGFSQKKPFNIDIDAFVPGQEVLGVDKIILNNSYRDPSYVREVLSYRVFRKYIPASKANFVKLLLNGKNWGVYVNVEHVGGELLQQWFEDNDGNRYKVRGAEGAGLPPGEGALIWMGPQSANYELAYEFKTENNPDPYTDLIEVCRRLNDPASSPIQLAFDPIFAIDRGLWMCALNNVFVNLDSYSGPGHNYYLFHDDHHQRMQVLPWDLNMSFGVFNGSFMPSQLPALSPFYGENDPTHPLLSRLLSAPLPREAYLAHMRSILRDFDWDVFEPVIAQYQALIDAEVQADSKKLYSYAAFRDNVTQTVSLSGGTAPGGGSVGGLKPFILARENYLRVHPELTKPQPSLSAITHAPADPTDTEEVWVTVRVDAGVPIRAIGLYWRSRGAFVPTPMFDDGLHNDGAAGDGTFGASIPAQLAGASVDYYVSALAHVSVGGARAFLPEEAEHKPRSYRVQAVPVATDLFINELLAKNNTGAQDEAGEYEDWIELVNTSGSTIDISGTFLTDDLSDPTQWQIPSGTSLGAGETLLVWADDDVGQGPLHANFKLSSGGEDLAFFAADGTTLLDTLTFGPQVADVSTARLSDGGEPWVTLSNPTPAALNDSGACGTRIYSALDSSAHRIQLGIAGTPGVGASVVFQVGGATPNHFTLFHLSRAAANTPVPGSGISALVDLNQTLFSILFPTNAAGSISLPLTFAPIPALAGVRLYLQVSGGDGAGTLMASNAVEIVFCP